MNTFEPKVRDADGHRYVLGFALASQKELVLLVKKQRGPSVNIGKWNGVGGKVEPGEKPLAAMIREFREETGADADWEYFGQFIGIGWVVDLFRGVFKGNEDEIAATNDVGEPLDFDAVEAVLLPKWSSDYAQNVPTMLAHAVTGEGSLMLTDQSLLEDADMVANKQCSTEESQPEPAGPPG